MRLFITVDTSRIVEKHCHISKRLKNEIKSKISETVSETYIAKETNVSVHTVRRIIDDTARLLTIKPLHDLPEHLCFDEFKSVKSSDSNMSFIIVIALHTSWSMLYEIENLTV